MLAQARLHLWVGVQPLCPACPPVCPHHYCIHFALSHECGCSTVHQ
jgi:hypothetical protein